MKALFQSPPVGNFTTLYGTNMCYNGTCNNHGMCCYGILCPFCYNCTCYYNGKCKLVVVKLPTGGKLKKNRESLLGVGDIKKVPKALLSRWAICIVAMAAWIHLRGLLKDHCKQDGNGEEK